MFQFLIMAPLMVLNAQAFNLTVKVEDQRSTKGHFLYLLFNGKDGFPDQPKKAIKQGEVPAGSDSFEITDLPAGSYALSIIHDENDNKKLDKNFIGIPAEGIAFSQNPKLLFGPPSFEKCAFEMKADETIVLKMKHF